MPNIVHLWSPQIKWKLLCWKGRIKPFFKVSGILITYDTELKKSTTLPSFFFIFFNFVQQIMPFPLFNDAFCTWSGRGGINYCKHILLILYGFFFSWIYSCSNRRCFLGWKFWWAAQSRRAAELKLQKIPFIGKNSTAE